MDKNKKTIIFDFGNVLLDLDFKRCLDYFHEVIGERWEIDGLPKNVENVLHKYECGNISDEAFLWVFQQFKTKAEVRDIIKAWNSILTEMPQHRLDMLASLKENYNLCILSNINNLHLSWIHRYFKRAFDLTDYEDRYFDKVFYSHLIRMRKPNDDIYKHVLAETKVDATDLVFIDDLQENISAAKAHGWHGIVHNPKNDIANCIQEYLKSIGF